MGITLGGGHGAGANGGGNGIDGISIPSILGLQKSINSFDSWTS